MAHVTWWHTREGCGCAALVAWAAAAAAASAASWWHRDSEDCSAELSFAMRRSACSFTSASCTHTRAFGLVTMDSAHRC